MKIIEDNLKMNLTEADLRRIEELQQIRNEDNKLEIDAEINTIIGRDPFLPKKKVDLNTR